MILSDGYSIILDVVETELLSTHRMFRLLAACVALILIAQSAWGVRLRALPEAL